MASGGNNPFGDPSDRDRTRLDPDDEEGPAYYTGRGPPMSDVQLLQTFDYPPDEDAALPAGGFSQYFFNSGDPQGATNPRSEGIRSQTSFAVYDDPAGYDDSVHNLLIRRANSRRGMADGGLVGRVKSIIGLGARERSEMDLPLTDGPISRSPRQQPPLSRQDSVPPPLSPKDRIVDLLTFGRNRKNVHTGPRRIYLNQPTKNALQKFVGNHVSTAKYNAFTFFPKFLYEQFSKYANCFFLFTAVLQQIPNISPTNRYTTIVPLIIVLTASAIKEMVEDTRRKSSDRSLNNSKTHILRGTSFVETEWVHVKVGDIVQVRSEQPFPADIVLLASSEPEGLCYIETANLDGETNLKIKQAIPETSEIVTPLELSSLSGLVQSEQPNSSLYTYEATLKLDRGGRETLYSLNPDQLLLRGATLRNTPWIHGIVVFTGHETKLMRNATATPIKTTAIARMVNYQILILGLILVILSVLSSFGDLIVRWKSTAQLSYLGYGPSNRAKQYFMDILTYWVLYSNLIPLSLFVTLEMVQYVIAFLINSDLDIYHKQTDTPANCRTSSLVEELGQIEYIFSDKTGTLTCNQMDFRQCSIAGIQYAETVSDDRRAAEIDGVQMGLNTFDTLRENRLTHPSRDFIHHFLTVLSICHTVIPERVSPNRIKYQAASPDEGALVEGAVLLDYKFTSRSPKSVSVEIGGETHTYETLAVCEFNSTRKRMSVIFRCPEDGRIRLYCKGADTVIMERLGADNGAIKEATIRHLEEYATEGLRTLCLAYREIPEEEFAEWEKVYFAAQTTVGGNRSDELDRAAEIIEKNLTLLGATAIEDKLQDGVPDTIHTLQEAGIKIWVLTGDRQETAINIGMSCKLISEDMSLLVVNEASKDSTRINLEKKLMAIRNNQYVLAGAAAESDIMALVIDGQSLAYALERDMEGLFLDLAVLCKTVICCRVSPLQKALVVKAVKRRKVADRQRKPILLAIGDGANDVSMIQAAHIGVGISGMEGLQAARSADVSIAQFRYLRKLLLVHGAWSYQRVSKVILFSFYKNVAFFMTQFWYSFQNAFSGQIIYESWTLSLYNVLFTVFPPFAIGIFDQFVSARLLDRYPGLYRLSQQNTFFRMHSFFSWIANGFYHSLLLFYVSQAIWYWDAPRSNGQTSGHWVWGTALYTTALITVLGKAALITNIWTKWTFAAIVGSFVIWAIFMPIFATVAPMVNFATEYDGVLPVLVTNVRFWLMAFSLPILCLLRDYAWKYVKRMYFPQPYHHVQEIQKYNVQDYRPRMEQFQKAISKVRQVHRMRKQRGYAFSQADESQARVLEAYDTGRVRAKMG